MSDLKAAPTTGPDAGAQPGGAPAPNAGIPQPQDSALVLGKGSGNEPPAEPGPEDGAAPVPGQAPGEAGLLEPEKNESAELAAAEAAGADGANEGEEEPVSTLSELIDTQEWDRDWFDSLKVPVKVDGKPAEASMKDLVASYQTQAAAENRLDEAKVKAKAQTRGLAERTQALEEQFAITSSLIEQAEAVLNADTDGTDWNALRDDDEGAYAARKADIAERREKVDQIKREAAEKYQAAIEDQRRKAIEDFNGRREEEWELLLNKVPEWRDKEVAKTDDAKLTTYLMEQGFSEQDVQGASDHRLIVLARKAMLFDEGSSKADAAKKKVRKAVKVMKPGAKPALSSNPKPTDRASILYGA